jgi:hypothetical protein
MDWLKGATERARELSTLAQQRGAKLAEEAQANARLLAERAAQEAAQLQARYNEYQAAQKVSCAAEGARGRNPCGMCNHVKEHHCTLLVLAPCVCRPRGRLRRQRT